MRITRIQPVSIAKVAATLYAMLGLLIGGVVSMIALAAGGASGIEGVPMLGAAMGVAAIIVFPVLYGALGFLVMLLVAALYNLAAGLVGGIEIDVQ